MRKKAPINDLPPEDAVRFKEYLLRHDYDMDAHQYQKWAGSFAYLAQKLASRGWRECPERVSLFWIRLHGMLTEFIPNFDPNRFEEVAPQIKAGSGAQRLLLASRAVYEAALRIRDALSEDEHIYADLRRQTEGHILQNGYELRVEPKKKGGAKLKETYTINSIKKSFHIDELDTRIGAFIRPYMRKSRNGELDAAVDFARKTAAPAQSVVDAYRIFNSP